MTAAEREALDALFGWRRAEDLEVLARREQIAARAARPLDALLACPDMRAATATWLAASAAEYQARQALCAAADALAAERAL